MGEALTQRDSHLGMGSEFRPIEVLQVIGPVGPLYFPMSINKTDKIKRSTVCFGERKNGLKKKLLFPLKKSNFGPRQREKMTNQNYTIYIILTVL